MGKQRGRNSGPLVQRCDGYFSAGRLLVQSPVGMALLHLPVIGVDQVLHQIKDQGFVQIGAAGSVVDGHDDGHVAVEHRIELRALLFKRLTVVPRLLRLDERRSAMDGDELSAVGLRRGFTVDSEGDW